MRKGREGEEGEEEMIKFEGREGSLPFEFMRKFA